MKKQGDKISKKELSKRIKARFGTEKACADMLGIKKSNFSNLMERRSTNFLMRLESVGIATTQEDKDDCLDKDKMIQILLEKIKQQEEELERLRVPFANHPGLDSKSKKING
jgi:hypothetical protein